MYLILTQTRTVSQLEYRKVNHMRCRCDCKWSVDGECTSEPTLVESDTTAEDGLLLLCESFEFEETSGTLTIE